MKYYNLACPGCTFLVTYYHKSILYNGDWIPNYEIVSIVKLNSADCGDCKIEPDALFVDIITKIFDISVQAGIYARTSDGLKIATASLQPCWKYVHTILDLYDIIANMHISYSEYLDMISKCSTSNNIDKGNIVWKACSVEKCCLGVYNLITKVDAPSGVEKLDNVKYISGTISLQDENLQTPCSFDSHFNCYPLCKSLLFSGGPSGGNSNRELSVTESLKETVSAFVLPNPSSGSFTFHIQNPSKDALKLRVFNSVGIQVIEKSINSNEVDQTLSIYLSNYPDGIYLYIIGNNSSIVLSGKLTLVKKSR